MAWRLILLMAMGLGAMYMMHLLAQDYNKIRQPVAAATKALTGASATLMRGKRDAHINRTNAHDPESPPTAQEPEPRQNTTLAIDWKRILSRDPFECLQSLICQLMSGAEENSQDALTLVDFLESTLRVAPAKVARAFSLGLAFRGSTSRCYDEYPFCMYSARTMMRILKWLGDE